MVTKSPVVLLTGYSGFLGHYLADEIRGRGLRLVRAGRRDPDVAVSLEDVASVATAVDEADPDIVLHCGALSQMGACEQDPELAVRINAESTRAFAESGVWTVVVSTDLVFDGSQAPYDTAAAPNPLSAYGRSKVAAEAAVLAGQGLAVRVPLLFGKSFDGRRGATDMLRGAGDQRLTLFTNEHRTPLHAADAARGLVDLLADRDRTGIVHLAGPERVSRFEFAQRFCALSGLSSESFSAGECEDPQRPRDVSLTTDWDPGRSLDEALVAS